MKIDALKRTGTRRPVYSGSVTDEDGRKQYELAITGSQSLIETAFSKVDFEIEIAPRITQDGRSQTLPWPGTAFRGFEQ